MSDTTFLIVVLFVASAVILYLLRKKHISYNLLERQYDIKSRELNLKATELTKLITQFTDTNKQLILTQNELNSLKAEFDKLKTEYKNDLNEKFKLATRVNNSVEHFKQQNESIKQLERENEELFIKAELAKKDTDFHKSYEVINQGKNVFITGGAGTGKSYILQNLAKVFPELRDNITSTTGISAINIGGITIHSWSGIGYVNFNYNKLVTKEKRKEEILKYASRIEKKIKKNPLVFDRIKKCNKLAIDEISMLSSEIFSLIDEVLQLVRCKNEPFGGIKLIVIGDFCQLPPVIKDNCEPDNQHFVFNSPSWAKLNLEIINLETIHRQKDKEFAEVLNNVRFGNKLEEAEQYFLDCSVLPAELDYLLHIYPYNRNVDARNKLYLARIDGDEIVLKSQDFLAEIHYEDGERILKNYVAAKPEDIFHTDLNGKITDKLEQDTKAKQELKLKIGCRIMLIKNIDVALGFANGSMGTVAEIRDDAIMVNIDKRGLCTVMRQEFETDYKNDDNIVLVRKQFPLNLAYAITIHKSQGLTFDEAAVKITGNNINCGQGYVALSRVRTKQGLYIIGKFPKSNITVDAEVVKFYENINKPTQNTSKRKKNKM